MLFIWFDFSQHKGKKDHIFRVFESNDTFRVYMDKQTRQLHVDVNTEEYITLKLYD